MTVPAERTARLCGTIKFILSQDSLSTAEAASLAGRLGFTLSWSFGRIGRAAMQPIYRASVEQASSLYGAGFDEVQLSVATHASLEFFAELLPVLRPVRISILSDHETPTIVWSDGKWEADDEVEPAGVGFVVAWPRERFRRFASRPATLSGRVRRTVRARTRAR